MTYEIMVCPLCGAQVVEEGGYDSSLVFSCEHSAYMDDYGEVEPLRVRLGVVKRVAAAVAAAGPAMEAQRKEVLREREEQRQREERRRAAMTPKQREAEDQRHAQTRALLHDVYAKTLKTRLAHESVLMDATRFYEGHSGGFKVVVEKPS